MVLGFLDLFHHGTSKKWGLGEIRDITFPSNLRCLLQKTEPDTNRTQARTGVRGLVVSGPASIPLHEVAQVRTLLVAMFEPLQWTSIRGCAYRVKFLGRLRLRSDYLLSAGGGGGGGGGGEGE